MEKTIFFIMKSQTISKEGMSSEEEDKSGEYSFEKIKKGLLIKVERVWSKS